MSGVIRLQAWLLTLNSQSTNPKFQGPLRKIWNHIITNMQTFSFSQKGASIVKVRESAATEIGPTDHKAHIHGYIEITSMNGLVSLNYSKIKKYADTQLKKLPGFVGTYFDAQLLENYNAKNNVLAYVHKGQLRYIPDEEVDEFSKFELD